MSFTLTAAPGTDIWRKPPTTNIFNAPTASPPGAPSASSGPLPSFRSARVSFAFLYKEQYDQAGLVLSFRPTSIDKGGIPPRWIKTGVEYYNANPQLSTVACDRWADWSVTPLLVGKGAEADGKEEITVSVERAGDEKGMSIWVYQIVKGVEGGKEEKVPLREICWVYGDKSDDWEVKVEAMVARPETGTKEDLEVEFREFNIVWE